MREKILCGIIGITNKKCNIVDKLIVGLQKLEYRGYDSVGIAVINNGSIQLKKGAGDLETVMKRLDFSDLTGLTGIAHTRWATHGGVNDTNAHPHLDCSGNIAVVHNGVIRNFASLRIELENNGHKIKSETDTELFAHLLEDEEKKSNSFIEALAKALSKIDGTYSFGILHRNEGDKVYFAKMRSPLIIGFSEDIKAIASDLPALLDMTKTVILLEDGEFGYISPTNFEIYKLIPGGGYRKLSLEEITLKVKTVELSPEAASKGGYQHFMIKEIYEQPSAIRETFDGNIEDPALRKAAEIISSSNRVFLTAAGTSYHASLVFSKIIAKRAKLFSYPIISSEMSYVSPAIQRDDLLIAISQSGETYDTLQAIRDAKKSGAKIISITNALGSAIVRESDFSLYTRAGPEIGVAATKTFLSQIMLLEMLSAFISYERKTFDNDEKNNVLNYLKYAPNLLQSSLEASDTLIPALINLHKKDSSYILGRGLGSAIAMEGALKIKEITYLHAESYPAGESKHGPIALVERDFPVYIVSTSDAPEIAGNAIEMAARNAKVIVVKPADLNLELKEDKKNIYFADMPPSNSVLELEPFILTPLFQIIAYRLSVERGHNPDKPRNLAKTVTVE
ncbi:MAG: glutamine--fructose-6-phosphate transaminase (isomerizing) [Caldisphaera sp.]